MTYLTYSTQVKNYLSIPDTLDTLAQFVLDAACDLVERETGRAFSVRTLTYTYNNEDELLSAHPRFLFVPSFYPVTSVKIGLDEQTQVGPSRWQLEVLTYPVTITVQCGEVCPKDVHLATLEIVQYNLTRLKAKNYAARTTGLDQVSVTYEFEVPLSARKILEGYKCPAFF